MQAVFEGVIFDMDGTLTVPTLDFARIRAEIGLPAAMDLVTAIAALPAPARTVAWSVVERHEAEARRRLELQPGAAALLGRLAAAGIHTGLVTRNSQLGIDALLARLASHRFDAVVGREFPFLKPRPEPMLHIIAGWGCPAASVLTVGDYLHDLASGRAAGTATAFFHNPGAADYSAHADFTVRSFAELAERIFTNR